jgi:phage shock protein E
MTYLQRLLLLLFVSTTTVFAADVAEVSADVLLQRSGKPGAPLILDVRTPEEFAQGHVPGAKNIPHDQIGKRLGELSAYKSQDVVLYCRSGRRAGIAADELSAAGFTKLSHLTGDMQQWLADQRPTEK